MDACQPRIQQTRKKWNDPARLRALAFWAEAMGCLTAGAVGSFAVGRFFLNFVGGEECAAVFRATERAACETFWDAGNLATGNLVEVLCEQWVGTRE